MMKKKTIIALLFVIAVFSIFVGCSDKTPAYTETNLFYKNLTIAQNVYVMDENDLSNQELEMIVSLQGIVAKTSPSIYIKNNSESKEWLELLKSTTTIKYETDPWKLVDLFKNYINDNGYVLYSSTFDNGVSYSNQSINYATTVAGIDKYLMVSESLQDRALKSGLKMKKDVRNLNTEEIFSQYKDKLTKKLLIHQEPSKWALRDYSISAGAMCFYSDYYDGSTSIKDEILSWADECSPIFGWTENEVNFVTSNSLHSKITIASDWSPNLSLYSGMPSKVTSAPKAVKPVKKQNKHYVAIVMSDGDNLQWMQNGFATDKKYFGSDYRSDFPLTWTVAPSMNDLAPQIMNYLYEKSSDNDSFIAGPSGVGYVNITDFKKESLAKYSKLTASYMKETGLDYINLLDGNINTDCLSELAKYPSVKGGVWSVGDKYIEGNGGIYWVNDKPFVTMRETLWRVAGDDDSNKYYGFVERVAQRINEYKVDPNNIEGYTVVMAHAWSIGSMDYIKRFTSYLDDDVELVTVPQLIQLITENVPHKNKTHLDDIEKEDIANLCPIYSEQYNVSDIDNLQVDSNREFDFAGENLASYKWKFGSGGLQYDFAGYSEEGIKLDGSDLDDSIDPMPNAWAVNKFTLSEGDNFLNVFASCSPKADVNYRVRAVWTENKKVCYKVLNCSGYEKPLNEHKWYKIDKKSPLFYIYDISEFKGKTVSFSIEQDDTGDGDGEVLIISNVKVSSIKPNGENMTSWSISDIAQYWTKHGNVSRHKEGICLENNGEKASITNSVFIRENLEFLNISFRKFVRNDVQDKNPKIKVIVNDEVIKSYKNTLDYVTVDSDEYKTYCYDLTRFINQKIMVEISSIEGEHACFCEIYLDGTVEIEDRLYPNEQYTFQKLQNLNLSSLRKWKDMDLCDWVGGHGEKEYDNAEWILGGNNGKTCIFFEGSDLGNLNDYMPNSWICNKFALGQNDKYFSININGSEKANTNLRVRILYFEGTKIVSTVLHSTAYVKNLDSYGYYLFDENCASDYTYDISSFIGKTVIISIEQDDNGDGSGEIIKLNEMKITEVKTA